MSDCDCYKIGGPWITFDPECAEHGYEAQRKEREIEALREDAERWRVYDAHCQSIFNGKRIGEWLVFDAVMEHGSRRKAIDAVRAAMAEKGEKP